MNLIRTLMWALLGFVLSCAGLTYKTKWFWLILVIVSISNITYIIEK